MSHKPQEADLPYSNVLDKFSERSLKGHAQFECIAANLDHIVKKSTDCSHRERRREQRDVAKLNQHLQVVFIRIFILYTSMSVHLCMCLPASHNLSHIEICSQLIN